MVLFAILVGLICVTIKAWRAQKNLKEESMKDLETRFKPLKDNIKPSALLYRPLNLIRWSITIIILLTLRSY
jgi:hypothetical protein